MEISKADQKLENKIEVRLKELKDSKKEHKWTLIPNEQEVPSWLLSKNYILWNPNPREIKGLTGYCGTNLDFDNELDYIQWFFVSQQAWDFIHTALVDEDIYRFWKV